MGIDIRLPIGMLFTAIGLILSIFGALSDRALYQRSLGINVNLWWGIGLLVFGVIMLLLGRRGHLRTRAASPAELQPPTVREH
jgi:hypothetical protein